MKGQSKGSPVSNLMGDLEDDQLFEYRTRCQVEGVAEVLHSATALCRGRPSRRAR